MYDIVIIGAGMAGLTAAIYAKRAGKSALIIENKIVGGQIVDALRVDNWPGDYGVSGADLMKKIQRQAMDLGAKIHYEEVVKITEGDEFVSENDAKDNLRKVWLIKTEGNEYIAKTIIVATGTKPRKLSNEQSEDAGDRPISYCATCDGALYKNKPVVVIGSGNTAKHEIKYLENVASKVYHIHHDEPIPKDAKAIFVAIGRVPATEILNGIADLDEEGYVVANEECKTTRPGIFVAGDCRKKRIRQLVTAAADGATAADAAIKYLA